MFNGMSPGWIGNLTHSSHTQINLGIWGLQGTGKTTFVGRLIHRLRTMESLDKRPVWVVEYDEGGGGKRADYFQEYILDPIVDGLEVAATIPTTGASLYQFRLTQQSQLSRDVGQTAMLSLLDAPGEYYEKFDEPAIANKVFAGDDAAPFSILDYLSCCHGILLLIDPSDSAGYTLYRGLVEQLLRRLRRYFPNEAGAYHFIQQYIAIVFTKADTQIAQHKYKNPPKLANDILGIQHETILQQHIVRDRFRYFAVSVHHITPQGRIAEPGRTRSGAERLFNPDKAPYKLEDPLMWLLEQINRTRPDLSKRVVPNTDESR